MRKKINIIAIIGISGFLCVFFCGLAHGASEPNAADAIKMEKEALAERLRRAQMESEMISYQRKQLEIEQRDIAKQQKIVADKERKLLSAMPRETLQQRLEAQSSLLAQSRRQLDDARRNVDLQIETLKSEIARQELARRSFLSKSNLLELKRRQRGQEEADRAKAADLERKKRDAQELAKKEQELNGKQEARRLKLEQQAVEKEVARQAALARHKEQERIEIEKRDSVYRAKESALRIELDTCKQALSLIEQEKNSTDRQSMQDRLDNLLEKQRALLDTSRKAERDLLQQKQGMQDLLEKAQATTFNKEIK
jgi:hypothetical protein